MHDSNKGRGAAGRMSRRTALKIGLAASVPLVVPARVLGLQGATPPSERIVMGFIGVGSHGRGYNMASFLQLDNAQVVAVCDVFESRRNDAKKDVDGKYGTTDCAAFADFRDLLALDRIDAVCISTPDHWHVPIALRALDAGKDVMCEKPTLTIAQGRALVDRVRAKNAVFQMGIEDRSVIQYHKLAEWVRNGAIGQLKKIIVGLPTGTAYPREAEAPVPAGLDYGMWLGPAPYHPYSPSRLDAMVWREIRAYSGGMLTDWGAHLVDTAQVANGAEGSGPVEVEGEGKIPENALTDVPVEFHLRYRYANGVEMEVHSGGVMIRFEGTDGWVGNNDWRGQLQASSDEILHTKYAPEESKLWPLPKSEHQNFLDCVVSRQPTTYTAEAGHRLSTALHLGAIAMQLGRKVRWDPAAESFVGDEAANTLRSRPEREDWKS